MNRWYWTTLALATALAWACRGTADTATDRFGDSLPEGAVQRLGTLRLRYNSVGDLGYLPDGRVVVASGNRIDIWDMRVGEQQVSHRVSSGTLTGFHVRRDGTGMIACDSGGNVYEWDFEEAKVLREWASGQRGLVSVYYSSDQSRVLTGASSPPSIKEWDLATGEELVSVTSRLHRASQVVYGPDDQSAFIHGAAGSDPVVAQYDLKTGELVRDWLKDYYTHTRSIALSADGERLLVGSRTRGTEWRIVPRFELLNTFRGHHGGAVTAVAYAPDPEELLTGSRDGSIRRWNRVVNNGEVLARWFAHASHVRHILVSPDGKWVLSYGGGNMLTERSITDGEPRLSWDRHELAVQAAACSPDGRAVSGSADGTVRVWDMLGGRQLLCIEQATQGAWAVAISPDGERIAAGCKDGIVREFSALDGQLLRALEGHIGYIRAVTYVPQPPPDDHAPALLSTAGDGSVRIWGASGSEPLGILDADREAKTGHRGGVLSLAVSKDGALLLSGGRDGTMRLWDLRQGAQKAVFREHRGWVEAVTFAGNSEQGMSASRDGMIRRWDLNNGTLMAEMSHGSAVMALASSTDGSMAFAGGTDSRISVWDASGQRVTALGGHAASINGLAVSADDAHVVSASGDSTLLVWQAPRQ